LNEERYRELVEGTDDLITTVDSLGDFTFVNIKSEKYLGYSPKECLGQSAFQFTHPEDQKMTEEWFKDCLNKNISVSSIENRQVNAKTNEFFWMSWTSSFYYDEQGNLKKINSIARNITDLKNTVKKLQDSEAFIKTTLDNLPIGIAVNSIDPDVSFNYMNNNFPRFYRTTRNKLEGSNSFWDAVYEDQDFRHEIKKRVLDDCASGDPRRMHWDNIPITRKSEETSFISAMNTPVPNKNLMISTVWDVTDHNHAEMEKIKLESQLRQSHKMEAIGTLAGGIAHDFNNILAAILGYADMAMDDTPAHSPAKYQIEQVLKAGNRAKELVKHILSFSRKETHERVPVQTHLIVKEALKLLRASIPTTVEIKQNIDSSSGDILADPTQIHQVIMNICTNAAQAMEEDGGLLEVDLFSVELKAEDLANQPNLKLGRYVKLTVKDYGIGIDKQNLDKIFDPYFTTKDVGKGSGMGLAVVIGIVRSHDGMITVESTRGKGTTFNLYFPRIEVQIHKEIKDNEPLPKGKEKILVVDDEESMVDMTKRRLERLGYNVTAKTSSTEALELFRSQPDLFDLVITDQTMPNLTGEQLAKKLMEIRPHIPIIVCTGYSSKVDAEKANFIGISAFIMKPVDKKELSRTIRQVLDN